MTVAVEFHFDFASPNTYYCHQVIPEIEARTGASFRYFPVLLGGIFKATNNRSPMEQFAGIKNKSEYNQLETERFIEKHNITRFKMNPNFPVNTLHIMRGAVFASHQDYYREYIELMYRCMWEQGLDMSDPAVIAEQLEASGLPAQDIIEGSSEPSIKQELIDNTTTTVERGSFGSPTFYVGNEIFFGKDKLADVEAAIFAAVAAN